jgi:hypothetical protein
MNTQELANTQERLTGYRLRVSNNYTCMDEQNMVSHATSAIGETLTQAEIAIALDECVDEDIERRGYSGTGAGAYLEVVFNDADINDRDSDAEQINDMNNALVKNLPLGDTKLLRRFIQHQRNSQIWDGHNYRQANCRHARELLEKIRQ